MKRWLLVVTPAIVIVLVGGALVVLADREPEPLPPIASADAPSPTPSVVPASGSTGSTGSSEGDPGSGPTGPTSPETTSGPTGAEAPPSSDQGGGGETKEDGEGGDSGGGGGGEGQTVTVQLVLAKDQGGPPVVAFAGSGARVVINATSVDVAGRLEVVGLDHHVDVKPGETVSLKFMAKKEGTFEIVLDKPANLVGQLYVLP